MRRAQLGEYAEWTTPEYLQALVVDALNVLIWQQTKDGHSDNPQLFPDPTWRPGTPVAEPKTPVKRRTPEELRAYFEEVRARARAREGGE